MTINILVLYFTVLYCIVLFRITKMMKMQTMKRTVDSEEVPAQKKIVRNQNKLLKVVPHVNTN